MMLEYYLVYLLRRHIFSIFVPVMMVHSDANLKEFGINPSEAVEERVFKKLKKSTQLEKLRLLLRENANDNVMNELPLRTLPIRILEFGDNGNITTGCFIEMVRQLKQLEDINISNTPFSNLVR